MSHPTDLSVLQLTPLDLLIDLHLPNPRQGPGGDAQTRADAVAGLVREWVRQL